MPARTKNFGFSVMIPVNEPWLTEKEQALVNQAVSSGWISSAGEYIERFEQAWADYCGRKHGISVTNGTTALQLAVAALELQPGDEVILPSFTIISCATAVLYNKATPVLVDIDPQTGGLDANQVAAKITSRTRAIMPVHIYGHAVDMDPIMQLADKHGLAIIEYAAEVHGAEYLTQRDTQQARWQRCGSFGSMSCFSFYANKIITTGEGGMVLCDDDALADKLRSLRNLCFQPPRRFRHQQLGFNFRMTNLQAAIGVAQVERIDDILQRKRWLGEYYNEHLANVNGIQLPYCAPWTKHVYWVYGILIDPETGLTAETVAKQLADHGVQTRPYFIGMHQQPVFEEMGLFNQEDYPVTERWSQQGLYLPSGLALTEQQIEAVCHSVQAIFSST